MKRDKFESIIDQLKSVEVPSCPDDFDALVIRRIRVTEADHASGIGHDWIRLITQPRIAFGLLTMGVALGAGTTAVASQMTVPPTKSGDPMCFGIITQAHVLECHHCLPAVNRKF